MIGEELYKKQQRKLYSNYW